MDRTWTFSDLEFVALWADLGEEFLPHPLMFTSRTEWWDDHLENLARARESLRDRESELEDLPELTYALRNPDLLVRVHGWDPRDIESGAGSVRGLGVRYGELGYVLTQLPGETYRHSGGFTAKEFPAARLAEELVALLPDTAASRGRDIVLARPEHVEQFDYAFGMSPAHETLEGGVIDRAADFLAAPATSRGTMEVVQGHSRFGPRGITRHQLEWRDVVDDGRYVITGYPSVAAPADRRRMVSTLQSHIAEVVLAMADE
ncbi:ESX secretion-associated protein EspG [Nocardia sp. NPDC057668]|uniref:ESX secretion-associated protein EspG n=1 Tax=Nocardia sp. NPDC057668 TaxID=3346202 RepID=UPI00367195B2